MKPQRRMSAKQFLYSVRDEQKEIEELKDRIYEQELSLLPAGISYDRDKVQTSPQDRMSGTISEVVDYINLLEKKLSMLQSKRVQAQRLIDSLDSSCERQVLDVYFLAVRKTKLEDVAAIIGYSRTQTYRYYNRAIEHLDKMVPNGIV